MPRAKIALVDRFRETPGFGLGVFLMSDGPSEKWMQMQIFDNSEEFVESLVDYGIHLKQNYQVWSEYDTGLGRADLIFVSDRTMVVVELKKELADESAVAQVLRYAGTFQYGFKVSCVVAAPNFTKGCVSASTAGGVHLVKLCAQVVSFAYYPNASIPHEDHDDITFAYYPELKEICGKNEQNSDREGSLLCRVGNESVADTASCI